MLALTRQDPPFQAGQGALAKAYFQIFLVFQGLKVLPATRTCLTQAGASASNTFWHPLWGVESRMENTSCRPISDREPTECLPGATDWRPNFRRAPALAHESLDNPNCGYSSDSRSTEDTAVAA